GYSSAACLSPARSPSFRAASCISCSSVEFWRLAQRFWLYRTRRIAPRSRQPMPSLLRNVAALIAALTILQLAGGLLGARLPLSFTVEGHARTEWGIVAAAYSAGFMMGAMLATTLLARVGNIRVYAACAAIFAVATLALHFTSDLWSWGLARMIAGIAVALMFAAIESWLSHSIGARVRGEVMSVYMVLTRAALALGPFLA